MMRHLCAVSAFFISVVISAGVMTSAAHAAIPNDPQYQRLKSWGNIALEKAWDVSHGSKEVVVAVLDSGVDITNPDLAQNIWKNAAEIPDNKIDDDGNGYVDDVYGWDFTEDDNSPVPDTMQYTEIGLQHGTVIAGLIGAAGNNGIAGTGVNWKVRIMPLRILDSTGNGDTLMALKAVNYAIEQGVDVINFSLVGETPAVQLEDAIERAYDNNIVVVAAAGNGDSEGVPVNLNSSPRYPVCYKHTNRNNDMVIGVSSVDEDDKASIFTNFGKFCVDVAAPGQSLPSTIVQNFSAGFTSTYGGEWSGTSVAAPLVSGTAALLKAMNPEFTPTQIKQFIQDGADNISQENPNIHRDLGAGRLNVYNTLQLAAAEIAAKEAVEEEVAEDPVVENNWRVIVGPQSNAKALIKVYESDGTQVTSFHAFENSFTGGVTVAGGDVDGDGESEIVVGRGQGGAPEVRIFETNGQLVKSFFVGELDDTRGVRVGAVDVSKDGIVEIVTVPLSGESERISIWRADGREFIRYSPGERYYPFGINMAFGVVNGKPRVVVSEQSGGDQFVEAWDSAGAFVNQWTLGDVRSQRPTLALADIDVDGVADIVMGSSPGNKPIVYTRPFDFGDTRAEFLAYNERFRGGVNVAAASGAIVTAPGKGSQGVIRVFDASGGLQAQWQAYTDLYRGGAQVGILP